MTTSLGNQSRSLSAKWVIAVFAVLCAVHFFLATANWKYGFLIGHEFRQAQTAIITEYIDKQDNFSLYYETPILGKPWAFPLELPFYQWCVVGVQRWLDIPSFQAARGVSLTCFYLTLPALYLLLGAFRVSGPERLVILSALLACPIYLFYSRSFLIDPMAAMFSAWFLASFVLTLQLRKWWWFVLATVTATIGILIKSLVFAVWLFPAALYGAWCLLVAIRARSGWKSVASTIGWGVGPVVLPYLAFRDWILYTDALKGSHPAAYEFTSSELSQGNFGTFSLSSRLDPETWQVLGQRWSETVGAPWIIGLILVVGILLNRRYWKAILGLTGLWLFGQLAFPYAYAFQDYYFYAGTFFLMLAFGVIIWGTVTSPRIPLWVGVVVALLPLGSLYHAYAGGYVKMQRIPSYGGSGLTAMLNDMLPRDSVIMGLGFDWSAIIPYYSKRRALMVRDTQRYDWDYLRGAIRDLDDEHVSALIVSQAMDNAPDLVAQVVRALGLFPEPMLQHREGDTTTAVYITPYSFEEIVTRMGPTGGSVYPGVELLHQEVPQGGLFQGPTEVSAGASAIAFPVVEPRVTRFEISYDLKHYYVGSEKVMNFHPDSSLVVLPDAREGRMEWRFGILDDAWDREGDKTDGVEFMVRAINEHGHFRPLFSRTLKPQISENDRGLVTEVVEYELQPGERLEFRSGGHSSHAYDWAVVAGIKVLPADSR